MATIKQDRKDFEALLNGLAPVGTNPFQTSAPVVPSVPSPVAAMPATTPVDNTAGTDLTVERMFDFDYDGIRKGLRKKARKTITAIVEGILPKGLSDDAYIQDKIEQDIETMTDLYMQAETNKVMQRSLVESVSRGNAMPRMYEVFGQLTDKIQAINKQIVATEQTLRKTYIDIKFELRDKVNEDMNLAIEAGEQSDVPALTQGTNNGLIVNDPRALVADARAKHLEKLKQSAESDD